MERRAAWLADIQRKLDETYRQENRLANIHHRLERLYGPASPDMESDIGLGVQRMADNLEQAVEVEPEDQGDTCCSRSWHKERDDAPATRDEILYAFRNGREGKGPQESIAEE